MSNQIVCTPMDLLCAVESRFGEISFDLAANSDNNAVMRLGHQYIKNSYFGPGSQIAENAFLEPWFGLGQLAFLNPPFADIGPWAERCVKYRKQQRIALLIPASVCTKYFLDYVEPYAYIFKLKQRPFKKEVRDCILALYEPAGYTGQQTWSWRE